MILEQAKRLVNLTERLSETLMAAAICADDIRAILLMEFDGRNSAQWGRAQNTRPRNPVPRRPLVDSSTFSVFWAGKTCLLRRTVLFRLAERLARQPNQYITADQLLRDVWEGGIKSPETIRSAVRQASSVVRSATDSCCSSTLDSAVLKGRMGSLPPRHLRSTVTTT